MKNVQRPKTCLCSVLVLGFILAVIGQSCHREDTDYSPPNTPSGQEKNIRVIIPTPSWIGYYPQLRLMGKHYHPFRLKPENGFRIQPRELDAALADLAHEKTQHLLVLNNPHNPTGVVYTKDELMEIARVCKKHNTYILADEICSILENRGNDGEKQRELERHWADHSLSPNDRENSATPPAYPIMTRHTYCARHADTAYTDVGF